MLIRAERAEDAGEIADVVEDAFARPETVHVPETGLVASLRAGPAWIPQLSLVALVDDQVVGHCLSTRGDVDGDPVLALGPLSVMTGFQGQGIGSALMRSTIEIAIEMSEALIGLLGDPDFYARFGFVPGSQEGVEPIEASWGRYFQVRRLPSRQQPTGVFHYPPEFESVS